MASWAQLPSIAFLVSCCGLEMLGRAFRTCAVAAQCGSTIHELPNLARRTDCHACIAACAARVGRVEHTNCTRTVRSLGSSLSKPRFDRAGHPRCARLAATCSLESASCARGALAIRRRTKGSCLVLPCCADGDVTARAVGGGRGCSKCVLPSGAHRQMRQANAVRCRRGGVFLVLVSSAYRNSLARESIVACRPCTSSTNGTLAVGHGGPSLRHTRASGARCPRGACFVACCRLEVPRRTRRANAIAGIRSSSREELAGGTWHCCHEHAR